MTQFDENPLQNKGDLMKHVYTKKELRNIDAAVPVEIYKKQNSTFLVMNYNNGRPFGKLENLLEIAHKRGIAVAVSVR